MLKKSIALLMVLAMAVTLFACGNTPAQQETTAEPTTEAAEPVAMNIITLKGPTGMGMAKMMNDAAQSQSFTLAAAPDEVVSAVVGGKADIAACPLNLAATLNKKTEGKIQLLAINTLGVLYVVSNGVEIKSVADLKGKSIVSSGQGATPEYALNYLLQKNGIDPAKDVTVEYKAEHSEVTALAASGAEGVYVLPEPNVTTAMAKNKELTVALNLTEEWSKISDVQLAMGCIVVNKAFAQANPDAVAKFLADYKASVDYVNANPDEASAMIESIGIVPSAAIAKAAIPRCNMVCMTGDEMTACAKANFQVLFDANPKSVGGTLPDDSFYYTAK